MQTNAETELLENLGKDLSIVLKETARFASLNESHLKEIHPEFQSSAANFLFYLGLRRQNLKALQLRLAHFGLSSLGRCESSVIDNLQQAQFRILDSLKVRGFRIPRSMSVSKKLSKLTWTDSEKILHRHTRDLFGEKPKSRHIYVMVTAPPFPEFSEAWVQRILSSGCNLIRINAAHDTPQDWQNMVGMIRSAADTLSLPCRILMDLPGPKLRTVLKSPMSLRVGDQIELVGERKTLKNAVLCTIPKALLKVKVGDRVLFDDGKFETRVVERCGRLHLRLRVTKAPPKKVKLRSEKGINFPDTPLDIQEVTPEDLGLLQFVSKNCDLVGLSFVQTPGTIRKIRKVLRRLSKREIGLILKIETGRAFTNLPRLLLEAMRGYPVGVMIARGDLGVEVGFERLVEVQEEILWLCEAAHIPVIWATQVLESVAKYGMPTRGEMTDAAAAVRAECVMLNKGPYIEQAVYTLDNILRRMEAHTYKKRQLYRRLLVAEL